MLYIPPLLNVLLITNVKLSASAFYFSVHSLPELMLTCHVAGCLDSRETFDNNSWICVIVVDWIKSHVISFRAEQLAN